MQIFKLYSAWRNNLKTKWTATLCDWANKAADKAIDEHNKLVRLENEQIDIKNEQIDLRYELSAHNRANHLGRWSNIEERINLKDSTRVPVLLKAAFQAAKHGQAIYICDKTLSEEKYKSLILTQSDNINIIVKDASDIGWLQNYGDLSKKIKLYQDKRAAKNNFVVVLPFFILFDKEGEDKDIICNYYEPYSVEPLVLAFYRYLKDAEEVNPNANS
jgi:hypothetical protein